MSNMSNGNDGVYISFYLLADAYMLEHNSLLNLYHLVLQCCECLSLWKLLCEYQFHLTVDGMKPEEKQRLRLSTFRSLVVGGKQVVYLF